MSKLLTLVVALFAWANVSHALDPPRGLRWGMSFDEVKAVLERGKKDDQAKLEKLSDKLDDKLLFPDARLPQDFRFAQIKKLKLLGEEVWPGFAVFNDSGELALVQYQFMMREGTSEDESAAATWAYYQKLVDGLNSKYGLPSDNQIKPIDIGARIASGTYHQTVWHDSTAGDQVRVVVTQRSTKISALIGSVTRYWVILEYASSGWFNAMRTSETLDEL